MFRDSASMKLCAQPVGISGPLRKMVVSSFQGHPQVRTASFWEHLRRASAMRPVTLGADRPTPSALRGHAGIVMTMRYVHPEAEQNRTAIEEFERFRAQGVLAAAALKRDKRITTKAATVKFVSRCECTEVCERTGGRGRDRTGDPLLAKQVLSQLSYTPTVTA